jgi:hypothetical protein
MSSDDDALRRTLEPPMRLKMALGFMPPLPAARVAALDAWLAEAAAQRDAPGYQVAVPADLSSVMWRRASAARGSLSSIANDAELARLDAVIERMHPARVGHYIDASADALDRGWTIPDDVPLARALAVATENAITARLEQFALAHGIDTCSRLARSLGAGNPFTELVIRLPDLAQALTAFAALGVPAPGAAVVDALRIAARPGASLSIWLTDTGVSKLGVIISSPTTVDVLRVCAAAGLADMERLAAVEGALGVDGAARLECATTGSGTRIMIEYDVA